MVTLQAFCMAVLLLLINSCGRKPHTSNLAFFSADSHSVTMSYDTYFKLANTQLSQRYPETISSLTDLSKADRDVIRETARYHTQHLYGVLSYQVKPTDFVSAPGTVLEKGSIKIQAVRQKDDHLLVHYHYQDEAALYHSLLGRKKKRTLELLLPTEPLTIYQHGFPKKPVLDPKTKQPLNMCTDHHDNTEWAFYYYWSADRPGCPRSFRRHLHTVKAEVIRSPSTRSTYPEYARLYENDQATFTIFVGPDESLDSPEDLGRRTFEALSHTFTSLKGPGGTARLVPMETAERKRVWQANINGRLTTLQLFFVDPEADDFTSFAAQTIRASSLFIFSGHSDDGYLFDPTRLFSDTGIRFPRSKYQIFFFNACSTYSFYHSNYFARKKGPHDKHGTKNLDILTNAIGSPFMIDVYRRASVKQKLFITADTILTLNLMGLRRDGRLLARPKSYQSILRSITERMGYDLTALTNVIGDEDNPQIAP